MGLAIGITPVAVFYIIIMLHTDWGAQVEKVSQENQHPLQTSIPYDQTAIYVSFLRADVVVFYPFHLPFT